MLRYSCEGLFIEMLTGLTLRVLNNKHNVITVAKKSIYRILIYDVLFFGNIIVISCMHWIKWWHAFSAKEYFFKGDLRKKLFLSFLSQTHKKTPKNPQK